jgi:hypothetical protein
VGGRAAVRAVAALALAALVAGGCGTTYVIPSEPHTRIYVDGAMVGRDTGTVRLRGFPGSAQVLVKSDDGREQRQTVHRSFTVVTFLLGFITYGVCWVACWEYPGAVPVTLPPAGNFATGNAGADPWLQAPAGWQAPAAPAAPP